MLHHAPFGAPCIRPMYSYVPFSITIIDISILAYQKKKKKQLHHAVFFFFFFSVAKYLLQVGVIANLVVSSF